MQKLIGYILLAFAMFISVFIALVGSALDLPIKDLFTKLEGFLGMIILAIFGGVLVIAGELEEIRKELKK